MSTTPAVRHYATAVSAAGPAGPAPNLLAVEPARSRTPRAGRDPSRPGNSGATSPARPLASPAACAPGLIRKETLIVAVQCGQSAGCCPVGDFQGINNLIGIKR